MSSEQQRDSANDIVVVQLLNRVPLFVTPWPAARQTSLSFTISWSLLKFIFIESVMLSNHLILCRTLLLLPSIFPSCRFFSSESTLHIRWPRYWSFGISPSNKYSGLVSIRIDWFDLLAVWGSLKSFLQTQNLKASILHCPACFMIQLSASVHNYWKSHSFDYTDLCQPSNVSAC